MTGLLVLLISRVLSLGGCMIRLRILNSSLMGRVVLIFKLLGYCLIFFKMKNIMLDLFFGESQHLPLVNVRKY